MAKASRQSSTRAAQSKRNDAGGSAPAFPYTTKPASLRKFLGLVPKKPVPLKLNPATLRSWGFGDTNDQSMIRVLKALGLVSSDGVPTSEWKAFMAQGGPIVLADAIRDVWSKLFESSHNPHKDSDDDLRRYFYIHSGGSDGTIALQIQTFKAVCEFADFSASKASSRDNDAKDYDIAVGSRGATAMPSIHIDLHIHLPENKSRRDYEYMFEDIAKYIYGKAQGEGEA